MQKDLFEFLPYSLHTSIHQQSLDSSLAIVFLTVHCSKIAEAEAAVSVNEKKWLVMHMHVQLQLDIVFLTVQPSTTASHAVVCKPEGHLSPAEVCIYVPYSTAE